MLGSIRVTEVIAAECFLLLGLLLRRELVPFLELALWVVVLALLET